MSSAKPITATQKPGRSNVRLAARLATDAPSEIAWIGST